MPSMFQHIVGFLSVEQALLSLLIDSKGQGVFQFHLSYVHFITSVFKLLDSKKPIKQNVYKQTISSFNMKQGRKISGGKYHSNKKKKFYKRQNQEKIVALGETKLKTLRVKGGNIKTIILKTNMANILIDGKAQKAQIKNVLETPQNRFLARQNRLLKSAVIETSLGKARITNRPSQESHVNAILLKE